MIRIVYAWNFLAFGSIAILAAGLRVEMKRKFTPKSCKCSRVKRDELGRFC